MIINKFINISKIFAMTFPGSFTCKIPEPYFNKISDLTSHTFMKIFLGAQEFINDEKLPWQIQVLSDPLLSSPPPTEPGKL